MRIIRRFLWQFVAFLGLAALVGAVLLYSLTRSKSGVHMELLNVPLGFEISLVSDKVPNARQIAVHPSSGTLFVGSREEGKVYRLRRPVHEQSQYSADIVAADLRMPSGLAMRGDDLYVADVDRIIVYRNIAHKDIVSNLLGEVLLDSWPTDRMHGWRYLKVGPDGDLYSSIGVPCNICEPQNSLHGTIQRINPLTGSYQSIAEGVRNSVGFDWHPKTGQMWFGDNGVDQMGDDVPCDEINTLMRVGDHFGFPYSLCDGLATDMKVAKRNGTVFVSPMIQVQAHSAVTGMVFHSGDGLPKSYRDALFVAEHGSWNRSKKVGYRVSVLLATNSEYQTFVDGWLQGETAWGRPSDVAIDVDNSLLIADDFAGAIYRVRAIDSN